MILNFKVKNAGAVRTNLLGLDAAIRRRAGAIMRKHAEAIKTRVELTAPRRTNFMADHVRTQISEQGLAIQVGWSAEDFADSESGQFYPPHVEFGTIWTPAKPSLFPAFEQERPLISKDVADLMADEVKKRSAR
jgi:hypothetical protein